MPDQPTGVAFLLAQLGAAATTRFAEAIEPLGLTPPQAGLLRLIAAAPASQQELAGRLGAAPSRIVGYLDDLERRGVVVRRPGTDRRVNVVTLTAAGRKLLGRLREAAQAHDAAVTAGLSSAQRATLVHQLEVIATTLGQSAGVHPGYRSTGPVAERTTGSAAT